MRTKIFAWPKEIYIFWIVEFILGLEFVGSILLIFFKDWGGLNQTQTQMLQSWFTLWIFILEIPTGVYGDVKGKKKSVLIGYIFTALGVATYTIIPNIYLFMFAEFLFAVGIAFISGAEEAWMYDTCKNLNIQDKFRDIIGVSNTVHMVGMVIASGLFIFVNNLLSVQELFRIQIITYAIPAVLLAIFVKGTDSRKEKSLKPSYLETAKQGFHVLKHSPNLKKLAIYTSLLSSTSYFVVWLYQEALRVLSVPDSMFGMYRIVLLVSEMIAIRIGLKLIKTVKVSNLLVPIAVIVAIGFILGGILQNTVGVLFVLSLAGGLGLQVSGFLSKDINDGIDCEQRATVLSFISMAKRLMLTVFNPIVGFLVDSKGVFLAFSILGIVSLLAIFFKPKIITK